MITIDPGSKEKRPLKHVRLSADLAIAGGGLAGTCAAVTAARSGLKVVLVQDRSVLGGNCSSEVRLWILGATSHMGNNNRWAREGGAVDEIMVENMHRNPEGNPVIVDSILLELVTRESNITLLLNTAVHDIEKDGPDRIKSLRAFCAQNSTAYTVEAPLYCDASGDGILGFLAGAAFRMGAETKAEFGEGFAPDKAYGELLGHSLYFYSRDTGRPVRFIAPSFALKDITKIPKWQSFKATDSGCRLWWLEWGGRLDTVHETEEIKWELWKVAYGVWDFIKNSGRFPDAENLTLEWVGMIPGKRESRRFEGDYILRQQDLIEQREFPDAVSFGGWAIDLHPADGVYSELPSCTQWHSKGVFRIPYRSLYSRNIRNLFLSGRIISVSHVAFGSTRVMATCANSAQAAAVAAAICKEESVLPAEVNRPNLMRRLQRDLIRVGQHIPGVPLNDPEDAARRAAITSSSHFLLDRFPPNGKSRALRDSWAMLLPVPKGRVPVLSFYADTAKDTTLHVELRASSKLGNFTPDVTLRTLDIPLQQGRDRVIQCGFDVEVKDAQYLFVCLMNNPAVSIHLTDRRVTGVLALRHAVNQAVAKGSTQEPPPGSGIESFEFWLPQRRPGGENFALSVNPPLDLFSTANLTNGFARPTTGPNAWVAAHDDPRPRLTLRWDQAQSVRRVALSFDTDFDHPMESVLWGHPEAEMPFCVRSYRLTDGSGRTLAEVKDNHQTRNTVTLDEPSSTRELTLEILETRGLPAALFEIRCYS